MPTYTYNKKIKVGDYVTAKQGFIRKFKHSFVGRVKIIQFRPSTNPGLFLEYLQSTKPIGVGGIIDIAWVKKISKDEATLEGL